MAAPTANGAAAPEGAAAVAAAKADAAHAKDVQTVQVGICAECASHQRVASGCIFYLRNLLARQLTRYQFVGCLLTTVLMYWEQDIRRDAFWLQRRITKAFGTMEPAEAQQLAEKVFKVLEVGLVLAA